MELSRRRGWGVYYGKNIFEVHFSGFAWATLPRSVIFISEDGSCGCHRYMLYNPVPRFGTGFLSEYILLLLYGVRSLLPLCYWSANYDFFDWWLLDYHCTGISSIIYPHIICKIGIIYFYIVRQYSLSARDSLFVVARIFLRIQSGFWTCSFLGLWSFIELKGISVGWYEIAFINKPMELVMISRPCHSNRLPNCRR